MSGGETGQAGMGHPADTELFEGALTCDLVLPARLDPGARYLAPSRSEALLHSLAVAEDLRSDAADDERGKVELPHAIQRVEAKLDLALNLLGRLAQGRGDALLPSPLRWSHRGIRLDLPAAQAADPSAPASAPAIGEAGVLALQPVEWLGDHIELPVVVLASTGADTPHEGHRLWLRFGTLSAGLQDALERHLFRLHRRQVAEARQAAAK